ncbi:MATE family efflux transporter [Treponema phagedenis]|nr:MATE family efflux transporter [Treponema phagedenis]NVP24249.1 MATE family efflux transporter [Treponema phagedenis]QKS93555.1 MATE family efflux transporter [Treponema phagedenis]QLC59760.1 MATE family efflux transporter [Treponema phagedenis]
MEQVKENKMGIAPVLPLIVKMSLLAMFSMLIQSLYNVVDSIFVARYNSKALTAVSLAFPIQIFVLALSVGTAIGLNSLISRRLGEKRQEEANLAATHGVYLGLINSAIFALIGIFGVRHFIASFTDDPYISENATVYLQIVCICSFAVFLQINFEKILQATGNMIYPMLFQLTGAITNIILDPIMIFGLLGCPEMGVAGAALATVIGQFFALVFASYILWKKDHEVHISMKKYKWSFAVAKEIYTVGFPAIIMQSIASLLITMLNGILIALSEAAVAVLGVYFKLQSFVYMPVFGLMQGIMPIFGYNFGAKKRQRMMTTLRYGLIIAVIITAIGMLLFWVMPQQLLSMFSATEEMLKIGVPALRIISLSFMLAAIGITLSSLFQAIGIGRYSLYISIMRQLVIILPLAYIFSKLFSIDVVWAAFPIAELAAAFMSIVMFKKVYNKMIRNITLM